MYRTGSGASLLSPATKLQQGNIVTPVCDAVHREGRGRGVLCPSIHHMSHEQGVSVQGSLFRGLCLRVSVWQVSIQGGLSVQGVSVQGRSLSRVVHCRGLFVWEVSV